MKFEDDTLVLSTGRRLYCHGDCLGLGDDHRVTYGYDGSLDDVMHFTPAERLEIAAYMCVLWTSWAKVGDPG